MLKNGLALTLRRASEIRKYPTADKNANISGIAWRGLHYYVNKSGKCPPPLSVFININSRCNLRCNFCDYGLQNQDSMFFQNLAGADRLDMPLDDFKLIIDKIKHFKPFVSMPATEPLLYKDIVEAVGYVTDQGLRVGVGSNGMLLAKHAEGLVRRGLKKIVVSIDGPEAIHDEVRGARGSYRKIMDGLRILHETKQKLGTTEPLVFVNTVISPGSHEYVEECVDSLPMDVIQQVDLRLMFFLSPEVADKHNRRFGNSYPATAVNLIDGTDPTSIDTDLIFDQVEKLTAKYGPKVKFFFRHDRKKLKTYYTDEEVFMDDTNCVFPWYTMQINTDGKVIAPQRCFNLDFGNILESDFQDIWNGPAMRQFRQDLRSNGRFPACSRCEGVNVA